MIATTTMSKAPRRQETTERHTPASIEHVAAELEGMVNTLRVSAAMLQGTPKIGEIQVRYERSMRDGIRFLSLWTNEVKTIVSSERLEASKRTR